MPKTAAFVIAVVCSLACAVFNRKFLDSSLKNDYAKAFWDKGSASLCFVLVGLLGAVNCTDSAYAWKVAAGLVMGIIGDQLLALRFFDRKNHDLFFAAGVGAFAIGHVLYVWALFGRVPDMILTAIGIAITFTAVSFSVQRRHKFNAAQLTVCGYIYMAAVSFMGAVSCAAAVVSGEPALLLFAVGGVCFVISDNTLCVYCYGDNRKSFLNVIIHATYYAAQLLIAWSLFLILN